MTERTWAVRNMSLETSRQIAALAAGRGWTIATTLDHLVTFHAIRDCEACTVV